MIILSKTHFFELKSHGEEAYPYECCGAFLGKTEQDKKIVYQIVRLDNEWEDDHEKYRRFAISSNDYLMLEKKADSENQQLLGFYHTHPDHQAKPSVTDLKFAWPLFSYIILSVNNGTCGDLFSYVLDPDGGCFVKELHEIS